MTDQSAMSGGSETGYPPRAWRNLLRKHGIRPKKKLSQHFLVDPIALGRVVNAAQLRGEDTVLEVGAGFGSLTVRLAEMANQVIAVEIDRHLLPALHDMVGGMEGVQVVHGDILQLDLGELVGDQRYCVVANIPYHITSVLIRRLLEATNPPYRLVLTIQKQVAERVTAVPGQMSLLALSVQLYGHPRVMARIPAGSFYPVPSVDSSVLRVDLHERPLVPADQIGDVFYLARAGFGQKRKQLCNALAKGLGVAKAAVESWLETAKISPQRRAQELTIEEWRRLARVFQAEIEAQKDD
ncbi:MAG: 16S rRNA (adenine(1518)-N(6)/adenine(1519)-N(6))-dimethyltransferase RsmA [Anaerolineales bacterium]|jgi:16S rRNA (adenine1518-N6/adenine1519-N6)-dimethyltransferase